MSFASPIIGAVQHECRCGRTESGLCNRPRPPAGHSRAGGGHSAGIGSRRAQEWARKPKAGKNRGQSRCLCVRVKASGASRREEGSAHPFQLSFGTKDPEGSLGDSRFRVAPQGTSCKGWKVWWFQLKGHFLGNFWEQSSPMGKLRHEERRRTFCAVA